jgi:hypothetical protein
MPIGVSSLFDLPALSRAVIAVGTANRRQNSRNQSLLKLDGLSQLSLLVLGFAQDLPPIQNVYTNALPKPFDRFFMVHFNTPLMKISSGGRMDIVVSWHRPILTLFHHHPMFCPKAVVITSRRCWWELLEVLAWDVGRGTKLLEWNRGAAGQMCDR